MRCYIIHTVVFTTCSEILWITSHRNSPLIILMSVDGYLSYSQKEIINVSTDRSPVSNNNSLALYSSTSCGNKGQTLIIIAELCQGKRAKFWIQFIRTKG